MWTKQRPNKDGFYWVAQRGELSGREYTHPVHLYNKQLNVFSDGENFYADSDMFLKWWSEEIVGPPDTIVG